MPPLDLNRNHLFKLEHPTQLDFRKYAAERPTLATEGFQDKLFVTKRGSNPPTSRPPLIVVSRPCARTYEARENALLNALCNNPENPHTKSHNYKIFHKDPM